MRPLMAGLTFRRPFTILGIVLALLVIAAFVLVALNAGTSSNSPLQSVVVATKELAPRQLIDPASLELKSIPVPAGYPKVYFSRIQDVQGMIPLVTIPTGQAVTSNDVARPSQALGAQSEYLPIPAGYVALTIPTSEQQGVADYIQKDDYISVIATVSTGGKVGSKTVFTNIHVIRVGTAGNQSASNSSASSLTVVVTECRAEIITWFLTYASLKYTLQSFHDYLQPGTEIPDPKCPNVAAAQGVTLQYMQATYPGLF
ncbi:MAG: Flp pilus assembly protein CpaB [Candidatus Dormibacteraeota bacterium]|nr:Flp pilus assembly protein CpaB [Candidatus Dormibacteraeota bacterium]